MVVWCGGGNDMVDDDEDEEEKTMNSCTHCWISLANIFITTPPKKTHTLSRKNDVWYPKTHMYVSIFCILKVNRYMLPSHILTYISTPKQVERRDVIISEKELTYRDLLVDGFPLPKKHHSSSSGWSGSGALLVKSSTHYVSFSTTAAEPSFFFSEFFFLL